MGKEIPFSLSEFVITKPIALDMTISDKIWKYHITPMIPVREELGLAIWASLKSGYRPQWYEKQKGRSGDSQHCFKGKGAVDWTCEDFKENRGKFLELIIKHTDYTRIAIYDGFIHCDYKKTASGRREVYTSNSKSEWKFLKYAA